MPRSIKTSGEAGTDREIDALWRELEDLKRRIGSLAAPPSEDNKKVLPPSDVYIEVTETDGDPYLSVLGLEFDSTSFEVVESGGFARINNLAGGLPANSTPPAVAAASATGTDTTHYALDDHTHEGVHQITPFGTGTPYRGDIVLKGVKAIDFTAAGGGTIEADLDYAVASVSSAYTATRDDDIILANASSAAFTISLYETFGADTGRAWHLIKKTDSSTNAVTVQAYGSQTIDGAGSVVLRNQGDSVLLICTAAGVWNLFPHIRNGSVVRKNSTGTVFRRRRLNLIEGTNVTLTVSDDATDDEIDITIAASGGSTSLPYWRMRGQTRTTTAVLLDSSYFEDDGANRSGNIYQWDHYVSGRGGTLWLPAGESGLLFWSRIGIQNTSDTAQTVNSVLLAYDDSICLLNQRLANGAGTVSFNLTTKVITGTGTNFTSDFAVNDYIVVDGFLMRITTITSATQMSYAQNPSASWGGAFGANYQIAKRIHSGTTYQADHNTQYNLTINASSQHVIHLLGNTVGGPAYWLYLLNAYTNSNLVWFDAGGWT